MGGGNLANQDKKKGFAISGILYPLLILTLFLVVQILMMLEARKNVLDKVRTELAESVNSSNKIYTNEELSILVDEINNNFLNKTYPVGSIYISYTNTNPSSLFGGTWTSYGTGRTLVGVDTSQTEFNTIGKTGGEKTHVLTINEMPNHEGHYKYWGDFGDGYYLSVPKLKELKIMMPYSNRPWMITASNELDFHTTNIGGGQAHNNLQPYITVYMWRRTA